MTVPIEYVLDKGVLDCACSGVPCIPAEMIEACIYRAARKSKKGKAAEAALFVDGDAPLSYDGPKDVEDLIRNENFRFRKAVNVAGSAVMRTRPIFKSWQCSFKVMVIEDSEVESRNDSHVRGFIEKAGKAIGLGDWRPKYGRFEILG
jgi:hypothetical protein